MVSTRIQQLWNYLLQLNLFQKPSSTPQTTSKEYLATRIYLISFIVSLLVAAFASILLVRTIEGAESSPSLTRFLHLASLYPNTLQCPCSKFGIDHNTFVTIHAHSHQVCSSHFVQQTWIDSIYLQPNRSTSALDDIRPMLSFFWQTIAGLCAVSEQTWNDTMAGFTASHLLTPVAVDEHLLRSQVQAALDTHISLAQATLNRDLLAIRRSITGNQLVSALATNFYLRRPPTQTDDSNVLKMTFRRFDNCSCLNNNGCLRSANVIIDERHDQPGSIPGMMVDCLMVDATLASTLGCYYQPDCFSRLHPSSSINIPLLSSSTNKHFSANDTVQALLNGMMIDEVVAAIDVDSFFSQCNPSSCSYSYSQRLNFLYSVTIIIGIFGGLSTLLRVTAVLIAEIALQKRNRHSLNIGVNEPVAAEQERASLFFHRCQSALRYLRQKMINFNLFERKTPRTLENIVYETRLTRAFIFFLALSSMIVTIYIVVVQQNQLITVPSPSNSVYQQLYTDHSDTLQCPCSHISVLYGSFINLSLVLHQVCSSDWISPIWLDYVTSLDPTLLPLWTEQPFARDFRTIGASYFQLLATFCSLVQITIDDAQRVFAQTQFVNNRLLSPPLFQQRTEDIVESFIKTTSTDFNRTFDWITALFTDNYFMTGANMDVDITTEAPGQVNMEEAMLQLASEITHDSLSIQGYCMCSQPIEACFIQSMIYTNGTRFFEFEQVFWELPIGCMPLLGFLESKTGWWYNTTYLINIYQTYAIATGLESSVMISHLDASVPTRFEDIKMGQLLGEILIERWINKNASFEQFYAACAPPSCSYTIVQRRSILVILLLVISVCSGLNRGLQLLVPLLGKIVGWMHERWKYRNTAHPGPRSITDRLKRVFTVALRSVININLFPSIFTDINHLRQERRYTRVYLLVYSISLGLLLFYSGVIERKITKTHLLTSITDYEHLYEYQSGGINCPCVHISIPYHDAVTELRVQSFHQACSARSATVILSQGERNYNYNRYNRSNDFRSTKTNFIKFFEKICSLAQASASSSVQTFLSSTMLANQLITRTEFNQDINDTLARFQLKTPIAFARTLDLTRLLIHDNAIMAFPLSNWRILQDERHQEQNLSFFNLPTIFIDPQSNQSCSCATSTTCTMPALIFNTDGSIDYTVPGFAYGCYLFQSVLLSSFSCLYSSTCIAEFRYNLELSAESLEEYHVETGEPIQLDATATRFNVNDTIETLAYAMFIESWTSNVSYERYFNSCAPTFCTYAYHYRFDGVEMFTTFLSVFSGLSLAIRFAVPYATKLFEKLRAHFRIVPAL